MHCNLITKLIAIISWALVNTWKMSTAKLKFASLSGHRKNSSIAPAIIYAPL